MKKLFFIVVSSVVLLFVRPQSAYAANACQWSATASTTAWATPGNWTGCGGVAPQTADTAEIISSTNNPSITTVVTIAGLTVTSGTLTINTGGSLTDNGDITLTSGTFNSNGFAVNIGGNWNDNGGTYTAGISTVTMSGFLKTIQGTTSNDFYNLIISSSVFLMGIDFGINGTYQVLNGAGPAASNTITMKNGSSISYQGSGSFNNLIIASSATVTGSGTIPVNGALTVNSGATFNPTGTVVLSGSASTIVTNGTPASFNLNNLTITNTGLTTGSFGVNGAFTVNPSTTFTASTPSVITMNNGSSIVNNGSLTFYGLTINRTGFATTSSFPVGGAFTVNAFMDFTASTPSVITMNNGSSIVNNAAAGNLAFYGLTIANGATVTTSGSFSVKGNWTNSGGTFSASAGTVTMNGTTQQVSGNTTFFGLAVTGTTARTVTLVGGSTTSIANNGSLTFSGSSGQKLTLQSDGGSDWNLQVSNTGTTVSVTQVNVSHSNAGGYKQIVANDGSNTNQGYNTNWLFGANCLWSATASTTDWATSTNWTNCNSHVPTADDFTEIVSSTNNPSITSSIIIDAVTTQSATNTSMNWSHTVGSGSNRILIVGVVTRGNAAVLSITYGAASLNFLRTDHTASDIRTELWYLKSPTPGTDTITVTINSFQNMAAGATSYFNVDQTTTFRTANGTFGSTSPSSVTLTTVSGDLVVDVIGGQNTADTLTPDASQAQRFNFTGGAETAAGSDKAVTSTSTTMSWTIGGDHYFATTAVPLIQAAATGVTIAGLTVTSGTLTMNTGSSLTVNGNITLTSGTFNSNGFAVSLTGNWTNNGATYTPGASTVTFNGTTPAQTIGGSSSTTFGGITIANTTNAVTTTANFVVGGAFTVNASTTFTANSPSVITMNNGSSITNSGNLNFKHLTIAIGASVTSGSSFNVTGDWTDVGGTFTASGGTVTFNGGTQQISGGNNFYGLAVTGTGTRTVTLVGGSTTTVAAGGSLSFSGAGSNYLTLQSDGGTDWNLQVNNSASTSVSYVKVSHSNAGGYKQIVANNGTNQNLGSNTNWLFAAGVTRLVVTLPGQTFVEGTGNTGTVANQTAGQSFNLVKITATDNNFYIYTPYSGSKTLAYLGPANALDSTSPTYTTAVSFTNGQSTTTLATTLYKAETTTVTTTDGGQYGYASSSFTVNPGNVSAAADDSQVTGPATVIINGPVTVSITLKDTWHNPVSGVAASAVTISGTPVSSATQPGTVTDANGVTTAYINWSTVGPKTVTVSINTILLVQNDGVTPDADGNLDNTLAVTVSANSVNSSVRGGAKIKGGTKIL